MLALHPRGATSEQIIWRFQSTGVRIDASELLNGLTSLLKRGEIIRDPAGRWRISEFVPSKRTGRGLNDGLLKQHADLNAWLYAVTAQCRTVPVVEEDLGAIVPGAGLADWSSLLSYYAATQRQDPRGQIEEFQDRHGVNWQIFSTMGHWWTEAELRVSQDDLPPRFRETLARRKINTAAIGWPVSVLSTRSGTSFVPALIVPVEWRFEGASLVLLTTDSHPAINPSWLFEIRRHARWTESGLIEHLLPEGEQADLASISDRMRHALATLGASSLRPADLARELSIGGTALSNAAGLFLPEDGTFTKGAADDLEALRDWTLEERSGTALSALLDHTVAKNSEDLVPVLSTVSLTETQYEAAKAALVGPVTLIQGPPGTGKSHVIMSLLISALMNGKTVLLAAKNHQAVDEVERRLKKLGTVSPILVRGRDADGQRDTNFLLALGEIARGPVRQSSSKELGLARRALLEAGIVVDAKRSKTQKETSLKIALSELVDRHDFLVRHLGAKAMNVKPSSLISRLIQSLRSLLRKSVDPLLPVAEDASLYELERRISDLRKLVTRSVVYPQIHAELDRLCNSVSALLPQVAEQVTCPDQDAWSFVASRVKEIEFQKIKSVRRMKEVDARQVLAFRPVWGISTLSVPSRVPLIPNLFDYVIFDEASQCDIASALPLLARAKRAVIVGDPMQLRFVPSIGTGAEHALMDAAGLPHEGRASLAQSVNSLFDFVERIPVARRMFLADQFRSAPAIVAYLNKDFYNDKLVGRREDDTFKPPTGYKAGLQWDDVKGHVIREDGGNINRIEAERVAVIVRRLADDASFVGSVGISPFNSQVGELQVAIGKMVSEDDQKRLSIRVATVDKFQGGEADVVIFSLVLASGAPKTVSTFLQRERRRLNVAVSRARALCLIVGDLDFARTCGIRHIEFLAERAITPWSAPRPQVFDSGWERRLDTAMRTRGITTFPQYPVGTRYLDFALDPQGRKIDIEVDGRRWHTDAAGNRKVGDILRDKELQGRGWTVMRFWVHELANDMENCLDRIERALGKS